MVGFQSARWQVLQRVKSSRFDCTNGCIIHYDDTQFSPTWNSLIRLDKINENSSYSIEIIYEMQTPTLFIYDRKVFF